MQTELNEGQIADVRRLWIEGKSLPQIHAELDLGDTIQPQSLRTHVADLPPRRKRARQEGETKARDGRTIRYFTEAEDARLIAWAKLPGALQPPLNHVAKDLDRKRHSLAARIETLKREGKIPAEVEI